jgi:hypothetical protein
MMLNMPMLANWDQIRWRKQAQMDMDSAVENKHRKFKDCTVRDEVLIPKENPPKSEDWAFGPFTVHQISVRSVLIHRTSIA